MDLHIIAGQSNAVGYSTRGDLDFTARPDDGEIPFWWRCGSLSHLASGASASLGWETLRCQPRVHELPASYGQGNFWRVLGFGPEIGFARRLQDRGHTGFGVLKFAWNGSGLTRDWLNGTDLYMRLAVEIEIARSLLPESRIASLVWVQGETDAEDRTCAITYRYRLECLAWRVRSIAENARLPIVVARINPNGRPYLNELSDSQNYAAGNLGHTTIVPVNGLETHPTFTGHWSSQGAMDLGVRCADAALL